MNLDIQVDADAVEFVLSGGSAGRLVSDAMSEQDDANTPLPVVLDVDQLSARALRGLAEEFVTRDGTDYGAAERSLDDKVARLETQLRSGEAVIVFDAESETANIMMARDLMRETGAG